MSGQNNTGNTYLQEIARIQDAQKEIGKKLQNLNEQEQTVVYLHKKIAFLLQDLGCDWTGDSEDYQARQEMAGFEEELAVTAHKANATIMSERDRLKGIYGDLENKENDLTDECRRKL